LGETGPTFVFFVTFCENLVVAANFLLTIILAFQPVSVFIPTLTTIRTRRKISDWHLGLLLVLILLLIHALRDILVPFVLAAGAAYVLAPIIGFLHKLARLPRMVAAVLLYIILIGAVAAIAWMVGPNVYTNFVKFSSDIPRSTHVFVARLIGGDHANVLGIHLDAWQISGQISGWVQGGLPQTQAMKVGGLLMGVAFTAVLFLVLLFYFMAQGPELAQRLLRLAPPEYRADVQSFATKADPILSRYVRGLLIIVIFTAVVVSIGMQLLFGVKHAWLLGISAGILELLPVVGPTVAAFLIFGSLAMHGGTVWTLAALAIFWFAVRQTIDQIVGPIVLGRAVRLPPVAVIFAFLAGGALLGLLGLLLAIPAAAMFKLLLDSYYSLPIE
jgi:predicted PurR-regulated permease PerM